MLQATCTETKPKESENTIKSNCYTHSNCTTQENQLSCSHAEELEKMKMHGITSDRHVSKRSVFRVSD